MDVRVVSIGALGAHPLWSERAPVRAGHATTTLIRTAGRTILVDPGLPEAAIVARLRERANVAPRDVTDVFLTSFRPDARRSIEAFADADWWIAESEREGVGLPLIDALQRAAEGGDEELQKMIAHDVAVLQRCRAAPDALAERVDLFPLPGVTPGLCGLLIAGQRHTTLVCGDAIPTVEHLEQGKVLPQCADAEAAAASFAEAIEIADLLILGRDNLVVNPTRRPF
ncbi:MAG: MBL fold metallo-hydrolase [Phycisphaerales bacterium]|nr:MBL fold metallo-hydrolase [Phycisphaerales bacterium]